MSETAVHDFLLQHIVRFLIDNSECLNAYSRLKLQSGERLSPSEFEFFKGIQGLRKNYLKPISAKLWR